MGGGARAGPGLGRALCAPDAERLVRMAGAAYAAERAGVVRAGGDARECARLLRSPRYGLAALSRHPALAADLAAYLGHWADARTEFAGRLAADLPWLRGRPGLPDTAALDTVQDVRFGAGDAHRGGRTVAVVTFRGGGRVVYKPRAVEVDGHLADLVAWFNRQGPPHPLRLPPVAARDGYGWCAFAAHTPCGDADGPRRFYWRTGAYLALFHLLGGYDLHDENLIAEGEHPAFIDVEALFRAEPAADAEAEDAAGAALRRSPLAVGLLPQCVVEIDGDDVQASQVGGLVGDPFAPTGPVLPPHRPYFNGESADPLRFAPDVKEGFLWAYGVLLARREQLLAFDGPLTAFAGDRIRHVLRHTSVYKQALERRWQDSDGAADTREHSLRALLADPDTYTPPQDVAGRHPAVLTSELRQLRNGDVPAFTVTADGRSPVAEGFLRRSGLTEARARLSGFSPRDAARQAWFVDASFASCAANRADPQPPRPAGSSAGGVPEAWSAERAMEAAVMLGDGLLETAVADGAGAVEWPALQRVADRFWVVGTTGLGLGDGVCGVALFLAELARLSGLSRFGRVAEELVASLADPADIPAPEELVGMAPGAFGDLGGLVRTLTRLGVAWRRPYLLDVAGSLVLAVRLNLPGSAVADVYDGLAGAVLVLRSLHRARPTPSVAAALREAGEHLLAVPGDAPAARHGYGHGGPGQAHALAVAAEFTGLSRYAEEAARLLDRSSGHSPHPAGPAGWDDGVAGTLAGCLGVLHATGRARPDPVARRLHTTAARRAWPLLAATRGRLQDGLGDDALRHGTMGVAEVLLTAGELLGEPGPVADARRAAAQVAAAVSDGVLRTGAPGGLWTPDLLGGTAGIGYGLLRAIDPNGVPGILLAGT